LGGETEGDVKRSALTQAESGTASVAHESVPTGVPDNHEGTPFRVAVDCYAGYRGEETPVRFRLGEQTAEVQEMLDRWLAPDHRYFKIRTADGDTCILRHDVSSGEWELTLIERAARR
jgi:hypothetical protein